MAEQNVPQPYHGNEHDAAQAVAACQAAAAAAQRVMASAHGREAEQPSYGVAPASQRGPRGGST